MVVAIIAILAAILLPALSKARERARQAVCMNNMKQIGLAMHLYTEDYDEYFCPYWSGWDWPPTFWYGFLTKGVLGNQGGYLKTKLNAATYPDRGSVFYCPSVTQWAHPHIGTAYAINAARHWPAVNTGPVCGVGSSIGGGTTLPVWRKLSNIKKPSLTWMIMDARTTVPGNRYYLTPSQVWHKTDQDSWIEFRHSEGVNVLFVDGHVEWRKKYLPKAGPYGDTDLPRDDDFWGWE